MKKVYDNIPEPDWAVLVGVGTGSPNICEEDLDELNALCETCNIKTIARVIQNRKDIDPATYIGKGKVEEVRELVQAKGATAVVFDVELSGSKTRNLESALGVSVLDRSKVILDIFAQRAQTMEGKLQVELAQLKYNLPRLSGSAEGLAKMKNSVGMRGPGEKKLELDRRTIRDQILALEQKLAKVVEGRTVNRQSAQKSGKTRVAIVGYTNSGKSTLLNTISKVGVLAEDKLFATLDPKTANVYIQGEDYRGVQILLTDTVGFIDKLPHEFIRAFESTLAEAAHADLLLHVVDVSNPHYAHQIQVVDSVLAKIGAEKIPQILVLNKVDLLNIEKLNDVERAFSGALYVTASALHNQCLDVLKKKILETIK
jgi:GTP-binding protein HflX